MRRGTTCPFIVPLNGIIHRDTIHEKTRISTKALLVWFCVFSWIYPDHRWLRLSRKI